MALYSLTWDDLTKEVSHFLGWQRTAYTDLSTARQDTVASILESGYRQFMQPEPLTPGRPAHGWSFLTPAAEFVAWCAITTSSKITVTGVHTAGTTVLTATSDCFYQSMIGQAISISPDAEIPIGEFTITAHNAADEIEVSGDATCTGEFFSLTPDGNYLMGNDFLGVIGDFTFEPTTMYPPLIHTGEGRIRMWRQHRTSTGRPQHFALRPVTPTARQLIQRFEMLLFPTPDADYTLTYRKITQPEFPTDLTVSKDNYPWGSLHHSETILESCLAIAEQRLNDEVGLHTEKFHRLLAMSVTQDMRMYAPKNLGYCGDNSAGRNAYAVRDHYVRYNNVLYP